MKVQQRTLTLIATLGSAALLLGAFAFQYLGGLQPCTMCLWQRWPHAVAMALGVLALAMPNRLIAAAGALSCLVGVGIALLHSGVERAWWDGPQVCGASAAQDLSVLSMDQLLDTSAGPELVLCSEIAWSLFGLSMANWNGLFSLVLAAIWLLAALRPNAA